MPRCSPSFPADCELERDCKSHRVSRSSWPGRGWRGVGLQRRVRGLLFHDMLRDMFVYQSGLGRVQGTKNDVGGFTFTFLGIVVSRGWTASIFARWVEIDARGCAAICCFASPSRLRLRLRDDGSLCACAGFACRQTNLLLKGDEGLVDPPLLLARPNVRIGQAGDVSLCVVGGASNNHGRSRRVIPTLIRSMPLLDFAAPAVATKDESKIRMTCVILATMHPLLFPPSLPLFPVFSLLPLPPPLPSLIF